MLMYTVILDRQYMGSLCFLDLRELFCYIFFLYFPVFAQFARQNEPKSCNISKGNMIYFFLALSKWNHDCVLSSLEYNVLLSHVVRCLKRLFKMFFSLLLHNSIKWNCDVFVTGFCFFVFLKVKRFKVG